MRETIIEIKNDEKKNYKCKTLKLYSECMYIPKRKVEEAVGSLQNQHEPCVFDEIMGELPRATYTTGCVSQNENPTNFKILKESLLVQKQTLHQQKAL